jgi:hypothetical protein
MKKRFTLKLTGLSFLFILTSHFSFAQYVYIPDANFKAALVSNPAINLNMDAEIDSSEALFYSGGMYVGTQGISDLTGIGCFWNLTVLDISQNSLSSVDLSNNSLLNTVICSFNSISCLDLGNQYNLTSLDASNNSLVKLNVKNGNNSSMSTIDLSGNPLLTCVQVDNVSYSTAAWPLLPGSAYYSTDCGIPVANFTSTSPVCLGDSIQFTNSSLNAVSYDWQFGDGTYSTATNPTHTYLLPSGYTCILTAHSDCYGSNNYSWNQYVYATDIVGHVTYSGGDVTSGTVLLLNHEPFFTSYDTVATASLNALGQYTIPLTQAPAGDFLVKVYPDTNLFPTLIPTYKDNVWAWDSANVFIHGCSQIDTADVYMYELPVISGPGFLSGTIVEGAGFGRAQGDPIHGVDVKLGVTGSSSIIANTETDTNGVYSFGNLPLGNYTIYADIPGLHRDSTYQLTLDSTNSSYNNLDYWVDSNSVYIFENIGIEEPNSNIGRFGMFPNPASDQITLVYSLKEGANVQLEIYNMLGIKLHTLITEEQLSGDYVYTFNPKGSGMKPGIYFVKLSSNNKHRTLQLMVVD